MSLRRALMGSIALFFFMKIMFGSVTLLARDSLPKNIKCLNGKLAHLVCSSDSTGILPA
jgi:hypothetical protein